MSEDRRGGDKPIPYNVKRYLNDTQLAALRKIEGFGWKLNYIRRLVLRDIVIVVTDSNSRSTGILEEDGELNLEPDIKTRETACVTYAPGTACQVIGKHQ